MGSRLWTYLPSTPGGPLEVDRALYDRLARETATRTQVDRFVVPIRSGRAWPVRASSGKIAGTFLAHVQPPPAWSTP